jgi:hypothetical protein
VLAAFYVSATWSICTGTFDLRIISAKGSQRHDDLVCSSLSPHAASRESEQGRDFRKDGHGQACLRIEQCPCTERDQRYFRGNGGSEAGDHAYSGYLSYRATYYADLHLPLSADEFVASLKTQLTTALTSFERFMAKKPGDMAIGTKYRSALR